MWRKNIMHWFWRAATAVTIAVICGIATTLLLSRQLKTLDGWYWVLLLSIISLGVAILAVVIYANCVPTYRAEARLEIETYCPKCEKAVRLAPKFQCTECGKTIVPKLTEPRCPECGERI
jgi:DNA-directed RNA polymerase subunit RPC12/RpoP